MPGGHIEDFYIFGRGGGARAMYPAAHTQGGQSNFQGGGGQSGPPAPSKKPWYIYIEVADYRGLICAYVRTYVHKYIH